MDAAALKNTIRETAHGEGFFDVRVARVELIESEFRKYIYWVARRMHADMAWMARNFERRRNPGNILAGARSMIMLGMDYYAGDHPEDCTRGKISRYAWGTDYHDIMLPRLKKIARKIKEISGAESRCYVDTGPVLERAWAVRAGLGWQGRNGCIINKKFGSWFFIGTIITTADLPADAPAREHCGSCRRCIDACPTAAIVAPGVVDSRKCIAYWTVEANAPREFPELVANHLSGWGFGCDICQQVCPWNKKRKEITPESQFHPRKGEMCLSKKNILDMDEDAFRERFRKSPIKRLKLAGIKRNFSYFGHTESL
ncbi:MAG: tRNA epoxyqueuosine(34) reductase QueG [Candidatus Kapaibacterium sp.]